MCSVTCQLAPWSADTISRQSNEFAVIFEEIHCSGSPVGLDPSRTISSFF